MKERLRQLVKRNRFLLPIALTIRFCSRKFLGLIYRARRPLVVKQYLRSHQVRKLQIGAGPNILPGWINTDKSPNSPRILFLDAAKTFPFADATIDYIYSEHLIEHLTYKQGQLMLHECFRVLKPSGRIRIATPDLETLIGLHTPQKSGRQWRYIHWIIDQFLPEIGIYEDVIVINNAFRNWGHSFSTIAPCFKAPSKRWVLLRLPDTMSQKVTMRYSAESSPTVCLVETKRVIGSKRWLWKQGGRHDPTAAVAIPCEPTIPKV